MENLKEDSEDNQIIDESEEESNEEDLYQINPKDVKIFWQKMILPLLVYPPQICPKCKQNTFHINESQKNDILNPFYIRCSNKVCRLKNLREYSFMKFTKRTPASIIYLILKLFILEKKNAKEIQLALKLKIKTTPNIATILKILKNFRLCIAE